MPTARQIYRITLADALSAHERALRFGGVDGVPNLHLVQSAIARPYNGYHRSIEKKAAALVESVSRNHGFADGNKRTALILLTLLLTRSGYKLLATNAEAENMVIDVVTKQLTFNELVAWFRGRIRKL